MKEVYIIFNLNSNHPQSIRVYSKNIWKISCIFFDRFFLKLVTTHLWHSDTVLQSRSNTDNKPQCCSVECWHLRWVCTVPSVQCSVFRGRRRMSWYSSEGARGWWGQVASQRQSCVDTPTWRITSRRSRQRSSGRPSLSLIRWPPRRRAARSNSYLSPAGRGRDHQHQGAGHRHELSGTEANTSGGRRDPSPALLSRLIRRRSNYNQSEISKIILGKLI